LALDTVGVAFHTARLDAQKFSTLVKKNRAKICNIALGEFHILPGSNGLSLGISKGKDRSV